MAVTLLSGCSFLDEREEPVCAPIEIYTPPKVKLPDRPVFVVSETSDEQATRDIGMNFSRITKYASDLEEIIATLLRPSKQ